MILRTILLRSFEISALICSCEHYVLKSATKQDDDAPVGEKSGNCHKEDCAKGEDPVPQLYPHLWSKNPMTD
jgi:hypothetical protein